jgi:hypothetical protein
MPNVGAANAIENWGATRKAKKRNAKTHKSKASAATQSFMDKLRDFIEKIAKQIREGKDSITITLPTGFAKKLVEFFQRLFGKRSAGAADLSDMPPPPAIPNFRYNNGSNGLPLNPKFNDEYYRALMGNNDEEP